jgi:hypothetical protein
MKKTEENQHQLAKMVNRPKGLARVEGKGLESWCRRAMKMIVVGAAQMIVDRGEDDVFVGLEGQSGVKS